MSTTPHRLTESLSRSVDQADTDRIEFIHIDSQFDCFDILIQYFREIRCVTVNNYDWKLSTCTSSFYQKTTNANV